MPSPEGDQCAAAPSVPSSPIRCIYWNVRSISGKKNVRHLQQYINNKQVDLLFLSETWQRKGQPLPELLGYGLISCMSDQTGGRGGVACYYKQEFASYISCYKRDPQGHYLWLKIDKELGFENDLFAAVCYFPPKSSTAYKGRDRLEANFPYRGLNDDIASFSKDDGGGRDFFVVGDFNGRIGNGQAPEAHRHGLARESADKKVNKFGVPLMEVCAQNDLIICNGVTQVWPRSGEMTCRSKSVVDYLLAPVSRARYLVKDIHILPLVKKSDHNAMNFTLRRPRPLQIRPLLDEEAGKERRSAEGVSSNASTGVEMLRPGSSQVLDELLGKASGEAPKQAGNNNCSATDVRHLLEPDTKSAAKLEAGDRASCDVDEKGREHYSPKSVVLSSGEWESASGGASVQSGKMQVGGLNSHGLKWSSVQTEVEELTTSFLQAPERERYARRMAERDSGKVTAHKVIVQEPSSQKSETIVARSVKCEPYAAPEFDAAAWLEAKTSRLLNKILSDNPGQQDRHKKPARIESHPIFPSYKKGYMTRNFDPLNKHSGGKSNNNRFDSGLNSKDWSRKTDEASVHEPIFLFDKRELMTINSRPASVTSPGLVHVARLYVRADTSCRGQSSDGSRLTTTGSWGPKGFKVGAGFRCTCMYPGHGREFQLDHPMKTDSFTRTMTVVEASKFSALLQNLKSAYDSGKLWKSITQFKIARKIVKAMR